MYSNYQKSTGKNIPGQDPKRRDYPKPVRKIINSLIGVDYLYLIGSVVQIISGLLMVTIGMLLLVKPLWLAAVLSSLGCIATMVGAFQLYDLTKNTDAVKKISHEAINRALKSQN
jgi:hypothetical protein